MSLESQIAALVTASNNLTTIVDGKIAVVNTHVRNKANPHNVTAAQLGAETLMPDANTPQHGVKALNGRCVSLPDGYDLHLWSDALTSGLYNVNNPKNGPGVGRWYIEVIRHHDDIQSNRWRTLRATSFGAGNVAGLVYSSTCSFGSWGPWEKIEMAKPGEISAFAGALPPVGTIECNGAALLRSSYAALFAVINTRFGVGNGTTTFNIPDLRGEFIRGWDHGRGIDAGRTLGSHQADAFKNHTHPTPGYNLSMPGNKIPWYNWANSAYGNNNANSGAAGGTETRPRNVALMYCITY